MSTSPKLETLVGKIVLIHITRLDEEEKPVGQLQYAGEFMSMNRAINVRALSGKVFTLPPDISVFKKAKPGIYRLQPTGEIVENPAFEATFKMREKAPAQKPSRKKKK